MASERLCCSQLLNISAHSYRVVVGSREDGTHVYVLNACKALHLLLDLYLMFTEKGLPLCYIIISFMSVWPQLLKIKNEWSSIHCNCSLSWILYAKIDTVLNVWNACGRQATASHHCGILVAQLLKYHRHLCTVFHNLPLPATLTVYCAVT